MGHTRWSEIRRPLTPEAEAWIAAEVERMREAAREYRHGLAASAMRRRRSRGSDAKNDSQAGLP